MACTVVLHYTETGKTLTVELFPASGGAIVNGVGGDGMTEGTAGQYSATVAEPLSGPHVARVKEAGNLKWLGFVEIVNGATCVIDDLLTPLSGVVGEAPESEDATLPDSGILTKQPGETRIFGIDFSHKLPSGATILSVTSIVGSPSGLTIDDEAINEDDDGVEFSVAGGTHGTLYKITATVTASGGVTLEVDRKLYVRNL